MPVYLNCHSYFSFKYGTMSPEELLHEAKQKEISCFALTDINNTSGILDFFRQAENYGIKPVAGIDFRNGVQQKFVGIAKNSEGFHELNKFLSHHLQSGEPIPGRAPYSDHAFIIYPFHSAPRGLAENEFIGISKKDFFKMQFSDLRHLVSKLVLLSTVTFRNNIDFNTHRLLRAMDKNTLLSKLDVAEQAQPDEIMYSEKELNKIYNNYPQLLYNTQNLLEQCEIDFEFKKNKNREFFKGTKKEDYDLLLKLCNDNLDYRYPKQNKKITERFKKEIDVITTQGFTSYFLINWDIVRYAQSQNYFYVGRGSGANSIVAYLLKITDVDPIDLDLYFERFINPSRTNPPDFDIDFSWNNRKDVIDYIFYRSPYGKKYKDTVALLATYSTFQWDATVRELGKVFGLPKAEIDSFSDLNIKKTDHISQLILNYGKRLIDFPNHLSIHAGGILISEKPITYYTALNTPPKGFPLTQFSMLEAEDVGLYKFDILSQRGLGKIKDAVEIIKQNRGIDIDIHDINHFKKDEAVKANLQTANLMGCFYVESPAMRMLLKKLKASTYLDLVAASSIIRPGVAQSGMMREYILRFHDESKRIYQNETMKELLSETFGVMVYQEDVIKVAHYFGKLSLEESDKLRRGMGGKYKGRQEFWEVKDKFLSNCRQDGHPEKIINDIWNQMESFGGYAFAKGHSASYAVESYQCMFLKTYYPLEYMVAVINNGGGFYATEFYVHEARMCGGHVHAPDINKSEHLTCICGDDIYLGYHLVAELETNTSEKIIAERTLHGPFSSLEDFMKRVSVSVEQLRILIRVGAFRFTGRTKKQLLWDIHSIIGANKKTEMRNELFEVSNRKFELPELFDSKFDDAFDEMEILGFPLCSPFELIRENIYHRNAKTPREYSMVHTPATPHLRDENLLHAAAELSTHLGKIVSIVGYSVTRKRTRTKKGEEMSFGTFLDSDGHWIDTTHFPNVLKQYPFIGKGCYLITGKVVQEFGFYSMDVTAMKKLGMLTREDVTSNLKITA